MFQIIKRSYLTLVPFFLTLAFGQSIPAQTKPAFLAVTDKAELSKTVPSGFYFSGLSAGTQTRNSAVGILGENRRVIAGLVDTSGYSSDIRGFYEGFLITDSIIDFGGKQLGIGAYGFGFSASGEANVYDLSGTKILTAASVEDKEMRRPRPLMMTADEKGIRLYRGKAFVLIAPK